MTIHLFNLVNAVITRFFLCFAGLFPAIWLVASPSAANEADGLPRFGAYVALSINSDVIRGVRHAEDGKIWLLLNPRYRDRELRLKISSQKGAGYRKWFTGDEVLISPANQDKVANDWTDWIRTESAFIEYWMDGQLVLHLQRIQ